MGKMKKKMQKGERRKNRGNEYRRQSHVQREHKDRLFCYLFGAEENRAYTLSLYNAVNDSYYEDPDAVEINTIREVIYLGMRNDVSFMICDELNMYEQQSTFCPNMPIRMLQYAGALYEKYIRRNHLRKYGRKLLRLPVPRLIVFYNGREGQPEESVLRLTDSFVESDKADIEVTVRMINVNAGYNRKIAERCKPLYEYSWLVEHIRQGENRMETIEDIILDALECMPDEFLIKRFLMAHKAEVVDMLLTEYNEAEEMARFREEGYEEGREEGLEKGREEGREEGRKEGRKEGREEGRVEGMDIGTKKAMELSKILIASGRLDDLYRAADDRAYREQLFRDYGIE